MKILFAETGQHVIEACRLLARKKNTIVMAVTSPKQHYTVKYTYRCVNETVLVNKKIGIERIIELKRAYEDNKCDVFYPFGFQLVSDYYEAIKKNPSLKMNTPYDPDNNYWELSDKSYLYDALKDTNIILPIHYNKLDEIGNADYPVIVKRVRGCGIKGNIILAWKKEDIISFVLKDEIDDFVIQQYIPGDIYDVGGFSINGEILCAVPQRRTITLPLRGGVAAVNDVVERPELIEKTKTIIGKSKWTGPFQVEFRQDSSTGVYYLIEVNAKMWGSSPLSFKSNPHLLDIALEIATGKIPKKSIPYKKNMRYRWLFGQELRAMAYGNFEDWKAFAHRFLSPSYYDFDIRDPAPDLIRLIMTLYHVLFVRKAIVKPLIDNERHTELNLE